MDDFSCLSIDCGRLVRSLRLPGADEFTDYLVDRFGEGLARLVDRDIQVTHGRRRTRFRDGVPVFPRAPDPKSLNLNPAVPGDFLTTYGTGLGSLTVIPPTGDRAPASPLARAAETPTIKVGGVAVEVSFAGLTPGSIGLAQFNIKLPDSFDQNGQVPLVIQFEGSSSAPVMISVR